MKTETHRRRGLASLAHGRSARHQRGRFTRLVLGVWFSAKALDDLSLTGGPLTVFDFSLFANRGWTHGQRLQDDVNNGLSNSNIEDLPRKFIAVDTHLKDKQPAFFQYRQCRCGGPPYLRFFQAGQKIRRRCSQTSFASA